MPSATESRRVDRTIHTPVRFVISRFVQGHVNWNSAIESLDLAIASISSKKFEANMEEPDLQRINT
ncbi:hypothetical protein M6B38_306950 [Iris pallida]|uniref:Uncharacterized protein n=1 Tax=Iris pallida TaxID=29817 RepID=A0AAX6HJX8_IRIPA|nr:hypothetical protein M6B38_306950 [Iris pallida]